MLWQQRHVNKEGLLLFHIALILSQYVCAAVCNWEPVSLYLGGPQM